MKRAIFLLPYCGMVALGLTVITSSAPQSTCQTPPPLFARSPYGTTFQVMGCFSSSEVTYDLTNVAGDLRSSAMYSMSLWQAANQNNGSQVNIREAGLGEVPNLTLQTCDTAGCAGSFENGTARPENATMDVSYPSGVVMSASVVVDTSYGRDESSIVQRFSHGFGHTMGLGDVPGTAGEPNCGWTSGATVMSGMCGSPSGYSMTNSLAPTPCDNTQVHNTYSPGLPCGLPPPGCLLWDDILCICYWQKPPDPCEGVTCPCGSTCNNGSCENLAYECSPIILAVGPSSAYKLTSADEGVLFDLNADGIREKMAWTVTGEPVAFLVLDRNGNGKIDDGTELFGNHSVVPSGQPVKNGFEALEHYDAPASGGNADRVLDSQDQIWTSLQLWIDWNHDGVSEAFELYALADWELARAYLINASRG